MGFIACVMMRRLFKVRTKVHRTFMISTVKWKKDLGRKSMVGGTSYLSLPEDGSLNGLNESLVMKTVGNWVDQWC